MATKKITKKETKVESKNSNSVIKSPRITEKAAYGSEKGVYTFNVAKNATKNEIKKAIKLMYNVVPVRVNITIVKEKTVFVKGRKGVKQGGKKAVVYLKAGEKIAFA